MKYSLTYAVLEVSKATFDEIAAKMREADYHHVFCDDGTIDMNRIALMVVPGDVRETVTIVVPSGYKNADEFLRDCRFERAKA